MRGGVDGKCSRLTLKQSKLTNLFLKAETLEALPNGRLPPFTQEARQAVRERLGKLAARMFVFTHVCGSGKTRELIIPAVVEHVLKEESMAEPGHYQPLADRLFVVLAAPTRKLVRTLMEEVDAALEAAGANSRCDHYLEGEFRPGDRGIIATCTHSLGKLGRSGKIQLLVTPAARAFHHMTDASRPFR
jgi:superfamily II DNA/RNA helicase